MFNPSSLHSSNNRTMSNQINFEGLLVIEQPLIKVPIESLRKTIRNSQKYVEKEAASFPDLLSNLANQEPAARMESLKNVKKRMENLKRKVKLLDALLSKAHRDKGAGSNLHRKDTCKDRTSQHAFQDRFY